jgi:muconolactone delta-isomerase
VQFLTISRRRTDRFADSEFAALVTAEIAQARLLYAQGFIRQLWHRADTAGVCMIIEADSEAHVREGLETLPLARAGMLEISIVPLKPYSGFGPPA